MTQHMYVNKRYEKVGNRLGPISTIVGMLLRLGIIILMLGCGKFFCDKAVDIGHENVSEYELESYTKSKLKSIMYLKRQGLLSSSELKRRVRELEANTKKLYLKENR